MSLFLKGTCDVQTALQRHELQVQDVLPWCCCLKLLCTVLQGHVCEFADVA